jgi:hypothetical protein
MQPCDAGQFAALIASLGEIYGRQITKTATQMYWAVLEPYELAEIKRAVKQHLSDKKACAYMPLPGQLIDSMGGSVEEKALLAWHKLKQALARVGASRGVQFDEPVMHQIVQDMGGMYHLGQMLERDLDFKQKDFKELYAFYAKNPQDYPPMLSGGSSDEVVFIGNDKLSNRLEVLPKTQNKAHHGKKSENIGARTGKAQSFGETLKSLQMEAEKQLRKAR